MIVFQLITAIIVRVEVYTDRKKPLLYCELHFDKDSSTQSRSARTCPHLSIPNHWENDIEHNDKQVTKFFTFYNAFLLLLHVY